MVRIRRAHEGDAAAIYHLIHCATQQGKILKRSRADIRKALAHFWVAEKEDSVIACCALEVYNKKLAEVRSLAVDAGHQRQGIASALLSHCLQTAKKRRVYEVLAITDRQSLFKRSGFSEQLHGQKALFLRV
jgi:amino-acid N-acetyltransferase